jgi:DNA-binding PadR family transcriptional regulator
MPRTDHDPDTDERTAFRAQWLRITAAPDTAECHAAILDARRRYGRTEPTPYRQLVDTYRANIGAKRYRVLNTVGLSLADLTDLCRIVDAGAAGLPSVQFDSVARENLDRLRLVAFTAARRPGAAGAPPASPLVSHHSPHAIVSATLAGVAVARAYQTRPVTLQTTETAALAKLEADNGAPLWPGTRRAERAARYWGLVTHDDDGWYRLTEAGRAALMRQRSNLSTDQIMPSPAQAEGLDRLVKRGGSSDDVDGLRGGSIEQCITRQWVARAGTVHGSRRPVFRITEAGRDALARWEAVQRRQRGDIPNLTPQQLQPGMRVRLANRPRSLNVAAFYVWVADVERVREEGKFHGVWQVWVTDDPGGTPYLYGGRAFHPSTRYQVMPPDAD